ncbi:MAG: serine/threonine protein kinase [Myxococcaceae bacterium]
MADASPADTPLLAADEYTGRKLGKYELACRLSTGGMSEIFLAYQRGVAGFRKYVVLKKILSNIRGEEEFVRMFVQEAKITSGFAHSNIAQVFDLDIAGGELFLAMEFVPGATLVEIIQGCLAANEPIPTGLSVMVARDTALALHYAHTFTDPAGRVQPVVHRDVAEKNIMVTYDGVTKLLDFGIAKRLDRKDLTQVGTVKGTSGYMSPEQIRGEKLDPRSDVFSLGVVLHECLVGHRLFFRKSREEEMIAALNQEVLPPSRKNVEVPPALDAVVMKALARDREGRFATARELARAIERAAPELIWEPEQAGALVRRYFAPRKEQTRKLLSSPQTAEEGSEVRFAQRLGGVVVPHPPTRSDRGSDPAAVRGLGEGRDEVTRTLSVSAPEPSPAETLREEESGPLPIAPRREPARSPGRPAVRAQVKDDPGATAEERGKGRARATPDDQPFAEAELIEPPKGPITAPESSATVVIDDADVLALVKGFRDSEKPPRRSAGARRPTDPGEEMRTAFDLKRASSPTTAVAVGLGIGLTVVALVYLLLW